MAAGLETGLLGDSLDEALRRRRHDLFDGIAAHADQVVVVLGTADRVCVVGIRMQALKNAHLDQQVQCAENRGPADSLARELAEHVVRGETAAPPHRRLHYGPPLSRIADSSFVQLILDAGIRASELHVTRSPGQLRASVFHRINRHLPSIDDTQSHLL
jgi:hypothetical protein